MASVSLCMIVKNEEKVLERCLESIRDTMDEIIIADTGSADRTKEIAARYTDQIFDFTWTDDFAAARNFSFSKAAMDFVMWLDADDVLTEPDRAAFLALKHRIPDTADVIMLPYHTAFDEEGRPIFSYYRERLVRRSIHHRWKGRVHEAIVHSGRVLYLENPSVEHRSVKTSYSDRNLRIYEKQLLEGEPFSPRDTFYYGRELYYHRHYGRASKVLAAFLSGRGGWKENKVEACRILSYCRQENGNLYGALEALASSFLYDTPRAEVCCEIGNLYMELNDYQSAVPWFELALTLPENGKSGAFVSKDSHGYLPCIQLCVCYDRLGDWKKAEEYNRKAGVYRPFSDAFLQNLNYFEQKRHHPANPS